MDVGSCNNVIAFINGINTAEPGWSAGNMQENTFSTEEKRRLITGAHDDELGLAAQESTFFFYLWNPMWTGIQLELRWENTSVTLKFVRDSGIEAIKHINRI